MIAEVKKIILKIKHFLKAYNEGGFDFSHMGNFYIDITVCSLFLKASG